MNLSYKHTLETLPASNNEDLKPSIRSVLKQTNKIIIVLDDDPTGTQTMFDIPVITSWEKEVLEEEFKNETHLFYILTNSRSLTADKANLLNHEIGERIKIVAQEYNRQYIIISRGDSTLRGHYPHEVNSLAKGLELENYHTAIIPAFFEGGRFTIDDIHYVKEEEMLIPASETPFAKDKTFGFTQSNLTHWIEEKTNGNIKSKDVFSFSIEELRGQSIKELSKKLKDIPANHTVIVNAASYQDLEKFVLAYLNTGLTLLFRTAASFVKALSGKDDKLLLTSKELTSTNSNYGGLIIAGSYVPKTTRQLNVLFNNKNLHRIELSVKQILSNTIHPTEITDCIEKHLLNGQDIVLYTSRDLQAGSNEQENLAIGNCIADFITTVTQEIQTKPKFIIAKGGITSSDIATKALKIKKAIVLGQALLGVPVWKAGAESKFPDMPYIIFPGNVGDDDALAELYVKMSKENQ